MGVLAHCGFSNAASYSSDYFSYSDDGTSITIEGYIGPGGQVSIPATIDGKPVTTIGSEAFKYSYMTGVTIPSSVTNIRSGAFSYSANLTSITIPSSVTSIGSRAFFYCTGLTSVTVPSGVTRIESEAFGGCWDLASVTIPNSVTSIGEYAFWGCESLTSVTIPSSVTYIERSAFDDCPRLTKATFLGNAPTIGSNVFVSYVRVYFYDGKAGFTWPTWYGYPTTPIGAEITIQQPVGSFLVDGSAKKRFGSLRVGKKGPARNFTIKNIGTKTLTGFTIKVNGTHAKDFIVTQPSKTSLAAGAITTFKVNFKPTAKGTRNAVIHVKSNDANENPFDIKLIGAGVK